MKKSGRARVSSSNGIGFGNMVRIQCRFPFAAKQRRRKQFSFMSLPPCSGTRTQESMSKIGAKRVRTFRSNSTGTGNRLNSTPVRCVAGGCQMSRLSFQHSRLNISRSASRSDKSSESSECASSLKSISGARSASGSESDRRLRGVPKRERKPSDVRQSCSSIGAKKALIRFWSAVSPMFEDPGECTWSQDIQSDGQTHKSRPVTAWGNRCLSS